MDSYYTPDVSGNKITLPPDESMHCVKVMRRRVGDHINVVDGKGNLYQTRLEVAERAACILEVEQVEQEYKKLSYHLHIGIAPTKNIDRFEWFLEKSTEIGVGAITPLLCEHSERKHLRYDRLKRILISAMKQSNKAYLPDLNDMISFGEWVKKVDADQKYIAHCDDSGTRQNIWRIPQRPSIAIAIGPEGDFSSPEIASAIELGFSPISMGDHRLRTETAGVVACSAVYFNMQG